MKAEKGRPSPEPPPRQRNPAKARKQEASSQEVFGGERRLLDSFHCLFRGSRNPRLSTLPRDTSLIAVYSTLTIFVFSKSPLGTRLLAAAWEAVHCFQESGGSRMGRRLK